MGFAAGGFPPLFEKTPIFALSRASKEARYGQMRV
jgi:hypothetical protein